MTGGLSQFGRVLQHADAQIAANDTSDSYRGWTIRRGQWPEPAWRAYGPDYDAWTEGEGEWCDNGEKADADTRAALLDEIDAWFDYPADHPMTDAFPIRWAIPLAFGLAIILTIVGASA